MSPARTDRDLCLMVLNGAAAPQEPFLLQASDAVTMAQTTEFSRRSVQSRSSSDFSPAHDSVVRSNQFNRAVSVALEGIQK